jgi:hypothetical protein
MSYPTQKLHGLLHTVFFWVMTACSPLVHYFLFFKGTCCCLPSSALKTGVAESLRNLVRTYQTTQTRMPKSKAMTAMKIIIIRDS